MSKYNCWNCPTHFEDNCGKLIDQLKSIFSTTKQDRYRPNPDQSATFKPVCDSAIIKLLAYSSSCTVDKTHAPERHVKPTSI